MDERKVIKGKLWRRFLGGIFEIWEGRKYRQKIARNASKIQDSMHISNGRWIINYESVNSTKSLESKSSE